MTTVKNLIHTLTTLALWTIGNRLESTGIKFQTIAISRAAKSDGENVIIVRSKLNSFQSAQ